jgi:hypothetical protein
VAVAEPTSLIVRLAPRPPGALAALAVPPGTRLGRQVSSSSVYRLKVTDGKPLSEKLDEVKAWPGAVGLSWESCCSLLELLALLGFYLPESNTWPCHHNSEAGFLKVS